MARKFTRIEFEDGGVVVVKTSGSASNGGGYDGYTVQGNRESGWNNFAGFQKLSHSELVDKVIDQTGKKVMRKLSHVTMA